MTVFDAEGRLVTGLPREAFEVFEDGEPQEITQLTNDACRSASARSSNERQHVRPAHLDARAAVERFLFDLLNPADEFFVMAFNHHPHILTRWTSAPDDVGRPSTGKPFGGTACTTPSSARCR